MVETAELTAESVLASAQAFDASQSHAPEAPETPSDAILHEKPKEVAEPPKAEVKTEEVKSDAKDTSSLKDGETPKPDAKQQSKFAQNEERKQRTWESINAEKEKIKAEREAIERERQAWQQERVIKERFRDEKGHTAEEYAAAAAQLRASGDPESVKLAETAEQLAQEVAAKENAIKSKAQQEKNQREWSTETQAAVAKYPALADTNSEMFKTVLSTLNEIHTSLPELKTNPKSLGYAIRAYELTQQSKDSELTKAENKKLMTKIEELQKKLSISPGVPSETLTEETDFSKLSLSEQRKRLEREVKKFDQEIAG